MTQLEEERNTNITETEHNDYDSDYALEADQNNTEQKIYRPLMSIQIMVAFRIRTIYWKFISSK